MKNLLTFLLSILFLTSISSGETGDKDSLAINNWLITNVINLEKPLFYSEKDLNGKTWEKSEFLKQDQICLCKIHPETGKKVKWSDDESFFWQESAVAEFTNSDTAKAALAYLGFYIVADQYMELEMELESTQMLKIWLDNEELGCKETVEKENPEKLKKMLKLETGVHKITIKTVAYSSGRWPVTGKLIGDIQNIKVKLDPEETMTIDKVLYTPAVTSAKISYDGKYTAMAFRKTDKKTKKDERWLEVRDVDSAEPIFTFRGGMTITSITWSPIANEFVYRTTENGTSSLWLTHIETGKNKKILTNIKNLESFQWSPTGDFLVYSTSIDEEEEKSGVRKLKHMPDRQLGNRSLTYLYKLNIAEGTRTQLTFGQLSTSLYDISEDGNRLIISRYHPYVQERPFSVSDFYVLDLSTMKTDSLFSLKWASDLRWSPDGEKILVTGGVSMFDGIGRNLPKDITPNDYDGQAFLYYVASGKVLPITKNFNPAVINVKWSKINDNIYLLAEDRSWRNLYEYDIEKNQFLKLETGMEAVSNFDLADQATKIIYTGTSATQPQKVCTLALEKKSFLGLKQEGYKVLYEPGQKTFQYTKLSTVKRWTFSNKDGVEIEGRYYLPPNFDATKKYPCIVYYYGGTSPVSRDFDGRYPYNYWSANGYVVYILQPSGSTGFGQEFAAKHVNEWGSIVPEEIILGTEKFVAAHSFVDKDKLGCIGASYGGFTTESLITKTDMFAAAVSHAGISAVPSYWGEGYWGYSYGAVANANTFPWSHPEVFMKNSALYNADKINTPLLMTHGTSDTNVPPGESIQLYTALKLLGKQVELLQCKDQDHFVLEYGQREKWSKSIVAWFDKYLKNDSDWWKSIYK
ncbi:MAG: S9 family peptidase [Candidatus Marinimicrobia bacterium]|nr:S9 family peptidase [Candidatus Neomarinimicrobiota bacterium]